MYAVIRTGGKQYRVEKGQRLEVELVGADEGAEVELAPVLVVDGDKVLATPEELSGATVKAKVVGRDQGPEDRRLHLQAEEQQPPALGPPPGPIGARDHRDHQGPLTRQGRRQGRAADAEPKTASRTPPRRTDVEEEGRSLLPQRPRLQRAAPRA